MLYKTVRMLSTIVTRPGTSTLRVARFVRLQSHSQSQSVRALATAFETPPLADYRSQSPYWQKIPTWRDVPHSVFLDYEWQSSNSVQNSKQLLNFLAGVLPENIPPPSSETVQARPPPLRNQAPCRTAADLINDIAAGVQKAPMSIRMSPHVLSLIDWQRPLDDPLLKQFVPMGSRVLPDHPRLRLDSLDETGDSPVKGVIHRYPDKAVFLASSVCPVYCRFCTRSYTVGTSTDIVSKTRFLPIMKKWEPMFAYIESTPALEDILVSGGDGYYLSPEQLVYIGERLLSTPHIRRIRFASKGLSVCPSRLIDPADAWTNSLIELSKKGRMMGKSINLHTHFNHPNEITWITDVAARRLFAEGVIVRNQTVLLGGVNNNVATMSELIRKLSWMNVQPYYVFQNDMVSGVEDLRTPLSDILELESQLRGSTAGFMMPNFVVNLPGGGGKRLACSYDSYDRTTGVSKFRAPESKDPGRLWEYWDPLWSLPKGGSPWDSFQAENPTDARTQQQVRSL